MPVTLILDSPVSVPGGPNLSLKGTPGPNTVDNFGPTLII